MNLKYLFNNWARETGDKYCDQQWLLSKWDIFDGVPWPEDKVGRLIGHIRTHLDIHPGCDCFLDLGCGGGWILDQLGTAARIGVGCDVAIEMLKNASSRFPLINGDACAIPFKDDSFERVLCYFVFINFEDLSLVEKALTHLVRVLQPGGKALIGQLPDGKESMVYEREKKRYLEYCEINYPDRSSNRDIWHIPVQVFERRFFEEIFSRLGCGIDIVPAFNPFYRPGEPETIHWRFDIVATKK